VALCHLRALIADAHDYANRPGAAAAAWAENSEALQRHFARGGLEWPLTPLYERVREAYSRSYPGAGPSYPKGFGSPVWSVRLLELADEAEAEGDLRVSVQAFFHALGGLDHYRHPDLQAALSRASEYVAKAETAGDSDVVRQAHVELCITHIRHGSFEEAEKHLAATEHMRTGSALRQAMWYCNLGRLRLAQGDHGAAQEALGQALRAARQTQERANWEGVILHFLSLCERGEVSARERTVHQVESPPGARRGRGRPTQRKRKPPSR
jgi:tetratricopeptide (TPR) repeat protein